MSDDPKPPLEGMEPTEEQIAELQAMQRMQAIHRTIILAQGLVPQHIQEVVAKQLQANPESSKVAQIAGQIIDSTGEFGQVLQDVANPEARASHPYWGVRVTRPNEPEVAIHLPKDAGAIEDMNQFIQYALAMSLCLCPTTHLWAALQGARFSFFQTASPAPGEKPKLYLPH